MHVQKTTWLKLFYADLLHNQCLVSMIDKTIIIPLLPNSKLNLEFKLDLIGNTEFKFSHNTAQTLYWVYYLVFKVLAIVILWCPSIVTF